MEEPADGKRLGMIQKLARRSVRMQVEKHSTQLR